MMASFKDDLMINKNISGVPNFKDDLMINKEVLKASNSRRHRILIGCTGSVASLKIPELASLLLSLEEQPEIRIVATEKSLHFFDATALPSSILLYRDSDEWNSWHSRGDPVLHIDLRHWADIFVVAPLDANTLAKLSVGICDNLLTCVARAWDITNRPLLFAPAMNTLMYQHPITLEQITRLKSFGYEEIPSIEKVLICGDSGIGAMAEVSTIVQRVATLLKTIKLDT